jgi:superfamily II DNA or RNA helicase
MTLLGLFGSLKTHIKTQELIELGLGTPIKINSLILDYSTDEKTKIKSLQTYQKQLKYIKEHMKRNELLSSLTNALDGNTLLLFSHTEHGKELFNMIYDKIP